MFTGDFTFNLQRALDLNSTMHLPQYEIAYCITNEPISDWLKLTPVANPRVLTVAASGDQPLLYAAHGATRVDTFDITINACAIMDFKTTALQMLSFPEYMDALQSLRHMDMIGVSQPTVCVANNMPDRTRELMQNIIKYRSSVFKRDMYDTTIFPSDQNTFNQIQRGAHTPFNFIWANLMNVHKYLNEKYDIINLSNIFEHYILQGKLPGDIRATIEGLWPHLRSGGYILCTTSKPGVQETLERFDSTWKTIGAQISHPHHPHPTWNPIVIQKTR